MPVIDITLPISPASIIWPGQPPVSMSHVRHLARGDHATVSQITMSVHTGTHVDAPCHFIPDGATLDALDLELLIGPALVVYAPAADVLTPQVLEALEIPAGTERLLVRTRNSDRWAAGEEAFRQDYVGLNAAGAHWVLERGVRLLGTDYLSVAAWSDSVPTHQALLGAEAVLVEGLNLSQVAPGSYWLICLPLLIAGAGGAPARAVLMEWGDESSGAW